MFLESLTNFSNAGFSNAGALAGLFAIGGMLLFFFLLTAIGIYVYTSFAYMKIAKRNKQETPGLAWIPVVGKPLVALKAAKMHWWPLIILILYFVPFLAPIAGIAFAVFSIIWNWKMMEAIGRPGWWAIFMLIAPVYWVLLGIAAWSD